MTCGMAVGACVSTGYADEDIWAQLKTGGNVVLMRHALPGKTGDPLLLQLDDCSAQRNLSDTGRKQAQRIGRVFRARSITVNKVFSSRYCRTQETAKLVFGLVTGWQALDLLVVLPDDQKEARTELVAERIGAYKGQGNLVMVTHRPNIDALTFELVSPGGFLVLKPDGAGGFDILGSVEPDELTE